MRRGRRAGWIEGYTLLAGLLDATTGIALMALPAATLHAMRIATPPTDLVLVRFLGAFVAGVGCAYFLPALRWADLRSVLATTAQARLFVGGFVAVTVVTGGLEPAWASVAFTDLALAAVQIVWLARRRGAHA